jgi:hypothetical protein
MVPGATALTRTPIGARSVASFLVSPTPPCFDAVYAERGLTPTRQATEATLTIAPRWVEVQSDHACTVQRQDLCDLHAQASTGTSDDRHLPTQGERAVGRRHRIRLITDARHGWPTPYLRARLEKSP